MSLPPSTLTEAFRAHVQATIRLTKVVLELEWTIFTRFIVGVIVATFLSIIYLVWTLRKSRRPLVIWDRLNKPIIKLFRPRIFAFLMRNSNPYSGSIDMTITTFSRGFCTGFMRDRHYNRNTSKRKDVLTNCCKKSIHATALATFAETVGELGLLSSLSDDKDEVSLSSLELEFKKKARGLITASTDFTMPEITEEKQEVKMDVIVKDRMLDTVAIVHLVWTVNKGQ
ncbi:hypothetical protein CU097_004344 [Rhizopus azygosporus]|uniref:Uncharacterized protein n=1 Tax=Rhizopus azygosporus TaxID=86630 RepID=A0A367JDV6_RHIAZ|nr:hypothetical protein CU097_004344 [Rhizopus azygosporus]